MKKLFITSSFADVYKKLAAFVKQELKGKRVTFIPTASLCEKVTFYVKADKKAFNKLGMIVDELEISTASKEEIEKKLQENEYIFISGGNTFFLLQELKRTGTDVLLLKLIEEGKPYIGSSAGSIILSPNIEYIKDMDDHTQAEHLHEYNSLRVVDFYPLPHYKNFPFKKVVKKIIAKYDDSLDLRPMSNKQVITVNGDTVEFLG